MRLVVALAVLAGCGGSQFVKLDPKKARSVQIGLVSGDNGMCAPTGVVELHALVTLDDGAMLQTPSRMAPKGNLRPTDLEWTSDFGPVDEKARLHLVDPWLWYDTDITIRATVRGRPDLVNQLVVVPRFDCDRQVVLDGAPGYAGESGGPAGQIDVALAQVETKRNGRLVVVRVTARGQRSYHFLDRRGPSGARLALFVRGGPGGAGVNGAGGYPGARGGDGTSGISGSTCQDGTDGTDGGNGGDGGPGGDGGRGGDGGDGGDVVIAFPASAPELAGAVEVIAVAGPGGPGGAGGRGGSGGAGGSGGRGGSGGSTTSYDGSSCITHGGRDGNAGRAGNPGMPGRDGSPGYPGRDGTITVRSDQPVEALFAEELANLRPLVR